MYPLINSGARSLLLLVVVTGLVQACGKKNESKAKDGPEFKDLPVHTVVYGGDVTFGRRINHALFDREVRPRIFGDVRPLLVGADIALVNGEGVIAAGGRFTDKGEPRPYMYRAHPRMVEVLSGAGIDVVTAGNNHSLDYGPAALTEMLDRLMMAGIDYTGAGHDLSDARTPAYRKVGDTVIAFVGADMTHTRKFAAGKDRPGTLYLDGSIKGDNEDAVVEELGRILKDAREHAHLVFFTPHWGECWVAEPSKVIRRLARRLIRAGYDGILGHSSHWFHGVELIDGKPVIYDAGNLLIDYGGRDDAHRDMLWELSVNKAGVTRIKGYPLWLERNRANRAAGEVRDQILATLKERSSRLGTDLVIKEGVAVLECDPGSMNTPESTAPPARRRPDKVRLAPTDAVLDSLPKGVTQVDVRFEDGIRLAGYRLLLEELPVPKAGQVMALYFTTDKKLEQSYTIHVEARGADKKNGRERKEFASHLPGDWILPTDQWPVGKIIQDWTLFRLTFKPEGEVNFYAGLYRGGFVKPASSDRPLVDGNLVHLGSAAYKKGARRVFDVFDEYLKSIGGEQ